GVEEAGGDPNVEVFEIAGSIKWFDVSKGYGFIVPDNGLADVLLHVTCLRAGGFQTAYEGARVHCQVLNRPRGLQGFRVISMAAGGWAQRAAWQPNCARTGYNRACLPSTDRASYGMPTTFHRAAHWAAPFLVIVALLIASLVHPALAMRRETLKLTTSQGVQV